MTELGWCGFGPDSGNESRYFGATAWFMTPRS
jgi:hypothetical protein